MEYVRLIETHLTTLTSSLSSRMARVFQALTATEADVAHLVMRGLTTKDIAATLSRAPSTIDFHRHNIRGKLGGAVNRVGAGAASAASGSVTPAREPDAPTGLSATADDQQVVLNWTAPVSSGGATILRYEYELDFSGTWTSTGGTATNYTVMGLTNGQSYDFRVRAVNRVGESAASGSQSATPTATLGAPDAPHSLSATPGNGQVRLNWVQPSGGAVVTRYEYELDFSGTWTSTGGTATNYTVRNLTNDQSYTFRGAGGEQHRRKRGIQFAIGHARGHGAGRATEPAIHARQRAGNAALDGARQRRRGADHGLRIRAGQLRDLDLHGQRGDQLRGDRSEQRSDVHVPGAGGELRRRTWAT